MVEAVVNVFDEDWGNLHDSRGMGGFYTRGNNGEVDYLVHMSLPGCPRAGLVFRD